MRLSYHTGVAEYARVNFIPSLASPSTFGVRLSTQP